MKTIVLLKSKWIMGVLLAVLIAVLVLVESVANITTASAQGTTDTCLSRTVANASITISGNRATGHFTLPSNCKSQVVSLVSYTAPNGTDHKPFAEQKLYKATTRTFNISGQRNMSVEVPDCFFQVDLVKGEPIESFATGRTYSAEGRMLTASGGGNKPCTHPASQAKSTDTPPVTIMNTNITNNVSVNKEDDEQKKKDDEAAKKQNNTEQPKNNPAPKPAPVQEDGELPDTGPGEIAALSFGTSMTAGLLYAYRRRYDSIVSAIISRF